MATASVFINSENESSGLKLWIKTIQLSLGYPNTFVPGPIRVSEIFE